MLTADLFFCSSIKDFGNDASFAVVDEYGKQATADSYDGITDDVIQQILRFLQNEKEQKAQLESRPDRYDRTLDAFSEMPVQRIEETILILRSLRLRSMRCILRQRYSGHD